MSVFSHIEIVLPHMQIVRFFLQDGQVVMRGLLACRQARLLAQFFL
jgi:hypothetical protein